MQKIFLFAGIAIVALFSCNNQEKTNQSAKDDRVQTVGDAVVVPDQSPIGGDGHNIFRLKRLFRLAIIHSIRLLER